MARKMSNAQKAAYAVMLAFLFSLWWKLCMLPFRTARGFKKFLAGLGTVLLAPGALLGGLLFTLNWLGIKEEGMWELVLWSLYAGAIPYGLALLWQFGEHLLTRESGGTESYLHSQSTASFRYSPSRETNTPNTDITQIPEMPVVLASSVTNTQRERPGLEVVVLNHLLYPDWAVLPACAKEITFSNRGGSVLCLNPVYPWANKEKIADDIAEMTGCRSDNSTIGSSVFIGRVTASAQAHVEELQNYFSQLHAELVLVKSARFQGLDAEQRKMLQEDGFTFIQWAGWRKRGKLRCGFCLHEWPAQGETPEDCPECHISDWKMGNVLRCELCQHEWNYSEVGSHECPLCGTTHPALEAS